MSVGSAFQFAVRVSAPGFWACVRLRVFRCVCSFRLAAAARLRWLWACVRSVSWRVFALVSLFFGCVCFCGVLGCVFLVFLNFLFVFLIFCWYDLLPRCSGCDALLAPTLWLSLRWGLRVFAAPVLCVLSALALVGSACCCRRRGFFPPFPFFSRCGCAVLSWWLVLGIDERGPGSGMRDAWGAGRSLTRRVCGR